MYQINEDKSIYVTRGDIVLFDVKAEDNGEVYTFQPGDLVRIKVFGKKNCDNVVLQKDFSVTAASESVEIFLDEKDTKIGEVINKPTDYWYEVELNPLSDPQTIVGYNEDGPCIFRLFPEGRDLEADDPVIAPEDIPLVDDKLDLTSERPIKNKAVARAVIRIHAAIEDGWKESSELKQEIAVERERINNLLNGGTAEGDELTDVRVSANGITHTTAGTAVREQISGIVDREDQEGGVYAIPLKYKAGVTYYESNIFKIPKEGFSMRITEEMPTTINGISCSIFGKVVVGWIYDGEFIQGSDYEANGAVFNGYSNRAYFVEPGDLKTATHAVIRVIMLGNGDTQLNESNISQYSYITKYAKVYTGSPRRSGGLLGASMATLGKDETEKYKPDWSFRELSYKYQSMVSPLPLKYVRRVSCAADVWMGAKIYKFDPITRETSWVETLNYSTNNPTFGMECVIDFEGYGDNYFALLCFGKVPKLYEYNTLGYGGATTATRGNTCVGFDMSDLVGKIQVDWLPESVRSDAWGGSPIVQKNIEFLKLNKHKTVPALYVNGSGGQYSYILGKDDFAGVFYGGSYPGGMFYYNVSPATYYAALLNPNSNAYGECDITKSGFKYGIMCSAFTMLAHGHPIPRSTFDLRYNKDVEGFELKPMNFLADLHKLKPYDVITQGVGQTGHSVLVSGIENIGDTITALKIMEAATPAIRDNVFFLHNGAPYYKENAEEWYQQAYDFMAISDPDYDVSLHDKANWVAPYTEPQRVMCNRGYGAVYIKGKTRVLLSIDPAVENLFCDFGNGYWPSFRVSDLAPTLKNGYNVVDLTDELDGYTGEIKVTAEGSDSTEVFYIIDVDDYNISLDTSEAAANKVKITVSHVDEVKYVEANYLCTEGNYKGKSAPLFFSPKFEGNVMTIPNKFETDIGVWEFSAYPDPRDYLNVIYKTPYDTNTFGVDAENDKYV